MWAAGQALAAALRAQAPRRLAQRAPAQRLAAALSPTLCDVWGARFASAAADGGAAVPPDGAAASTRIGGAGWLGAAGSSVGAAAVRGWGDSAAEEAAQAEPQKRRQRAPNVGVPGEKTADGKPKPDESTVADLVERGWFESEEDAVALLTRAPSRKGRFPYETAKPVADWLEATLGRVPLKGVLPAAKAVKADPLLLCCDEVTLQRKWDALTLPEGQGGVGIALSPAQAREAVLKHPQILGCAMDTLKRGWSMLTASEGGLGLSPEEARSCILRSPEVLRFDHDAVVRRVELLRSLGYPKAYEMVLDNPNVLNYKDETVKESVAWWKQTELDHQKIVGLLPTLLGGVPVEDLQAKLDFLRIVVGMSTSELNKAHSLFGLSLDRRLRTRYFYTLREKKLARFGSINTMMQVKDSVFLAMLQRRPKDTNELASDLEVERYKEQVASAEFVAWREEQEALLLLAAREQTSAG
jgi:hypothetical protein